MVPKIYFIENRSLSRHKLFKGIFHWGTKHCLCLDKRSANQKRVNEYLHFLQFLETIVQQCDE